MTTPELPPLPPFCITAMGHQWLWSEEVQARDDAREARERILLAYIASLEAINENNLAEAAARIAELEADAARYRWLAAKASKDTAYDRYGNGAQWSIGFFAPDGRHALDTAIDAAREAKP